MNRRKPMAHVVALVVIGVCALAGPAPAQEIFSDGFEWGSLCAWSNDLWYPDGDIDLFGDDQATGVPSGCPPPTGMEDNNWDCDDLDPLVSPAAAEICNGLDDNCNGLEDDLGVLGCYTGPPSTLGVGECRSGTQTCVAGSWTSCYGEVLPMLEECADSFDNDCDASTDCSDNDCLGQFPPCLMDGQVCGGSSDCLSGHCQNGFCCAAGDCCSQASNCSAAYSQPPTCFSPTTCQGSRVDAVCTGHTCGSDRPTDDDSACGPSVMANHCSYYPDLFCDGAPDQEPPTCPNSCNGDFECDAVAHCDDTVCEADFSNGSACDEESDCISSHCDNGYCCDAGTCCSVNPDCPIGMECSNFTCVYPG